MNYETDEEQIAAIKEWWKKNGTKLLIALLVVAGSWSGWIFYQNDKMKKSANASAIFEAMQISLERGNFSDISREGLKLLSEQPASPYAAGASFLLAKHSLQQNKPEEAKNHLQWVVDNSKDPSLVLIAQIRKANLLIDSAQYEQAESLLSAINVADLSKAEQGNLAYAKATVALKTNNITEAISLLTEVVNNSATSTNLLNLAQLQLDDLAQ
ncbi:MAG TPA: hypothetical protein DD716_03415 [Thiomicrospira sp.]|jgi:predicted negative regulator of RcsB-dependent stress response|nr:hypothetical protein [Thiomicrospira sp.]